MSTFRPTASAGPSAAANQSPAVATTLGGCTRKVCAPPLFGDFGKDAKDLFKKKYDFDNQAKFISKPATGGSIETTVVAANDQPLRGVFLSKVPVTSFGRLNGDFESEFHTVAEKESKMTYKLTNLSKALTVKLGLSGVKCKESCPNSFKEGWGLVETEYKSDHFTGSAGVRTDGQLTLVDLVAATGIDKLSVGAKATINTADRSAPNDYNFGAQYNGVDYVASAVTENKRSVLNLSYFQRLASKPRVHNFGATFALGLAKPTRTFTVGSDYRIDADTSVRAHAKIDSEKSGTLIQTSVQHRLLNPNLLLGVSAEFNAAPQALTAGRVGVSLTFGDFDF
jgi:hypothetical protein